MKRLLLSVVAWAGFQSPFILAQNDSSKVLSRGIFVQVSPKGQKTLSKEFHTILSQNGIVLDEIVLPAYVYESPKALGLEDLPPALHEPITKLRTIFEEWLLGFEWNDPRPRLEVAQSGLKHQGLEIDLKVLEQRNPGDLRIQLEVKLSKPQIVIERIRLSDLNNDFLGEMGTDKYTFSASPHSPPLHLTLVVSSEIDRGNLAWRLESLKSNLNDVDLEASFQRPLILPEVELRVGTRTHKLNTKTLETKLLAAHPGIIKKAKVFLSEYIETDLVKMFQATPHEPIDLSSLGETNTFIPPGAPKNLPQRQYFNWKLVPQDVSALGTHLQLSLAVDLWDPIAQKMPPLDPSSMATLNPTLLPKASEVDLDLILNQGFLNRVVQLSFARKYFEKHELEPGEVISFKSSPKLWIPPKSGSRDMELLLDFEAPLKGLQKFFVGKAVHIRIPVQARFERGPGGFQMKMIRLQIERMWINPATVNGLFMGTVEGAVKKKFSKLNSEWSVKPSLLIDSMPVPDSIMGLGLKVKDMQTDPAGYIHFLIDFEKPGPRRIR